MLILSFNILLMIGLSLAGCWRIGRKGRKLFAMNAAVILMCSAGALAVILSLVEEFGVMFIGVGAGANIYVCWLSYLSVPANERRYEVECETPGLDTQSRRTTKWP